MARLVEPGFCKTKQLTVTSIITTDVLPSTLHSKHLYLNHSPPTIMIELNSHFKKLLYHFIFLFLPLSKVTSE